MSVFLPKRGLTRAQVEAAIIEPATFQALRWGVRPGATALTAKLQDAIDAVYAAGGGTLACRPGDYTGLDGITLKDGVYLDFGGSGNTTLDFSAMTAPVSGAALYGSGALTALPALASPIAMHGTTITFASAPDVAAGDILVIYDSADFSFSTARSYYRAGEYVRVKSVAGNVVTLTNRTYAAYASGGTVGAHKLTPIRTGISGARMVFKPGSYGINVHLGADLVFDDLVLRGTDYSHLALERCYGGKLAGIDAWDNSPEVGLNYGVSLVNCQAFDLDGCFLETSRHGLTVTGRSYTGSVPNREIHVRGGRISGMSTQSHINGCNLHGNVEHVSFTDVDMPHGVDLAGDYTTTKHCRIRSGADNIVHFGEVLGLNHVLESNELTATVDHANAEAHVYLAMQSVATRPGGTLRIAGNRLNMGGYGSNTLPTAQRGILIYNLTGGTSDVGLDISDNEIWSSKTAAGTVYGIMLRAGSGLSFRDVRTNRNRAHGCGAVFWLTLTPATGEMRGNISTDSPDYGLRITANAAPITTPVVTVADNVSLRAWSAGMSLFGTSDGLVICERNTSLDHNRSGTASNQTGVSIQLSTWGTVVYRNNAIGDRATPAGQVALDSVLSVTTLDEADNLNLGTVTAMTRSSITTRRFRGRGSGAPAFVAAVGSTYLRTDGGAGSTVYVNETGTATWAAK